MEQRERAGIRKRNFIFIFIFIRLNFICIQFNQVIKIYNLNIKNSNQANLFYVKYHLINIGI